MTYGGDEEIVLKGGAKSVKAGDGKVVEQKNVYARSYFARIQTSQEAEWEYACS
jgi:hypothetical protein